jgi:hypothetical protein
MRSKSKINALMWSVKFLVNAIKYEERDDPIADTQYSMQLKISTVHSVRKSKTDRKRIVLFGLFSRCGQIITCIR